MTTTRGSTGRAAWSSRRAVGGATARQSGCSAPRHAADHAVVRTTDDQGLPARSVPDLPRRSLWRAVLWLAVIDGRGLKVAATGPRSFQSPEEVERAIRPADEPPVQPVPRRPPAPRQRPAPARADLHLHADAGPPLPDRPTPQYPNVAVAGGFSGHGFKFAAVVGEVLADLVESGRTRWPIGMFAFGRLPRA